MARRAIKLLEVESCIIAFLKYYRKTCRVGTSHEGTYYWNEREVQWELFRHLRERSISHGIGSKWWFHAEGVVEKPKYSKWGAGRRGDIVMVNHSSLKRWIKKGKGQQPPYDVMIEIKLVWSGQGVKGTFSKIREDARKLAKCLNAGRTSEAHLILLDGLDSRRIPYYNKGLIRKVLKRLPLSHRCAPKLRLWHFPDSDKPVTKIKTARWEFYPASIYG